ncbi:uncharacterized protein [Primulina huaijiensis]|uniref:uncharacterized protein isoform X1 n=1 Tax=Primulina huaijiensis TaxID=1492673 RepID=UPI003CC70B26
MPVNKVIAICQSGGEFESDTDGVLSYKGGDAHAMEIDDRMKFKHLKLEVAEMFNYNLDTMRLKYFIPGNRKTLISISNDKDIKRMIKFHNDSDTVEIFVVTKEIISPDESSMPGSRSSRTIFLENRGHEDTSPTLMTNVVDDMNMPNLLFDATFDLVGDNSHDGLPTEMPVSEIQMPVSFVNSYAEKHAKAAQQWTNNITGVGQRFSSVNEFRDALRKYAIAHQFAFKYKKNDGNRVTVKCKSEGCPWRIHASRLATTPLICIKKMNSTHTCEGSVLRTGYQATRSWIAGIVKEKLKVYPNYKPKDIVNDIKEEYGIELNYFQAWRGKETAKEQLQGSYKEAYSQLPSLCKKIMETNPGSLATFSTREDSSFHRLFISFDASLHGFERGCRSLLFLDSIFLKSKYQGSLLAATTADGDDRVFPVAFAIVDMESDENWCWFLQQLKSALRTCHGITFVADREKGLRESIAENFHDQDFYHSFCLHYLSEQLIRDLKGQFSHEVKRLMVEDLFGAARSPTSEGFHQYAENIKTISVEAYNWVMQSEPIYWANAFFQGARYNHMKSNFGETFYSWISDAHELPIIQMVDTIRSKIMELIYTQQVESNKWLTRLTPSSEEKIEKESLKARTLHVLISAGNKFEVRGDTVEDVDVDNCDCSCKSWQLSGLPCCHAIAVITCLGRDPYDYCSRYFTADSYRITFSESINPILNVEGPWQNGGSVTVTPPPTRRPPGRPTTKRGGSQVGRRQLQCSRCKATGHNRSSCKEFLLE